MTPAPTHFSKEPKIVTVLPQTPAQPLVQAQSAQLGRVIDGDTLVIMANGQQIKLRLAQIDAPEKSQEFGTEAASCLSDILKSGALSYADNGKDKYGRTIAQVFTDSIDVNKEMVSRGCAWAYTEYVTDQTIFPLQAQAKAASKGLWAASNPTAPWDYRHGATTPSYDRVLNWAEYTYNNELVNGSATQNGDGFIYRCYSGNFCVGVNDLSVYIYDGNNITPVGDLSSYLTIADQQGF